MSAGFARTPEPPYYAVIFSSRRTRSMMGMARWPIAWWSSPSRQAGFLGVESTRGADGFGITVSYWSSLEAIAAWKAHGEHRIAQTAGRSKWYSHFEMRIARVERAYSGP